MRFDGPPVLDRLALQTGAVQALVLVGPSGGGKTTLLRILAGLDRPVAGSVAFDGVPLPADEVGLRGYRRTVGTVFQAYNLFPHLSAQENLLLPLVRVHGLSEVEAREPLSAWVLQTRILPIPRKHPPPQGIDQDTRKMFCDTIPHVRFISFLHR
ncbi:MAG: amino acid ABC transporter ATP-binding protein [Planctomycetia bacterium]|nr:amino acid ABC transporter ATP-binding protein [Planctomycetia bacterium]